MLGVIILAVVVVLAVALGLLAYSSNNRKRAGQKGTPAVEGSRPSEHRASGQD